MTPEQKDQFSKELYDLLTRFGNSIGIQTHSIYSCEFEGDAPRGIAVYEAIQNACIELDDYASEED